MAFTTVPTITTGDVATAAWGNTYIKDNFAQTFPGLVTTDGDIVVATGSAAGKRLAATGSGDTFIHEVGGLEANVSAGDGYVEIKSGSTTVRKSNLAASDAPDTGDDTGDGYTVGSIWIDTTNDKAYICLDNSSSAAVWTSMTLGGAFTREGGDITESTTTSTSFTDLQSAGSLTINAGDPFIALGSVRKATGAVAGSDITIKMNSTVVGPGTTWGPNANAAVEATIFLISTYGRANYLGIGSYLQAGNGGVTETHYGLAQDADMPTAQMTTLIFRMKTSNASATVGAADLNVYTGSVA